MMNFPSILVVLVALVTIQLTSSSVLPVANQTEAAAVESAGGDNSTAEVNPEDVSGDNATAVDAVDGNNSSEPVATEDANVTDSSLNDLNNTSVELNQTDTENASVAGGSEAAQNSSEVAESGEEKQPEKVTLESVLAGLDAADPSYELKKTILENVIRFSSEEEQNKSCIQECKKPYSSDETVAKDLCKEYCAIAFAAN